MPQQRKSRSFDSLRFASVAQDDSSFFRLYGTIRG
jgi:hypothetical protein